MKTTRSATAAASLTITLLTTASFAVPPAYIVTDLDTLSGPELLFAPGTVATGLSRSAVVGYSVTTLPNRNLHAFRVVGNAINDLGVLPDDQHSIAYAANAAGDAVGVSYKYGELAVHGVLWPSAGGIVSIGSIEPRDINAAGAIAGSTPVGGAVGTTHASLLVGGVFTDLGTLGGPSSMGLALNSSNWVVGESMLADGKNTRAFVWRNGSLLNLGTLGGLGSRALDIEGLNVAGIADTAANLPHATLWTLTAAGALGTKTDLGTLPGATTSAAYGVNSNNVVVGTSDDRAFRWTAGTIIDLNTQIDANAGWQLSRATAIDSEGRIVGSGRHLGLLRGFVLTPRNPADLDSDGTVGAADLAILLGGWGTNDPMLDLDGDGTVGARDLGILLGSWG